MKRIVFVSALFLGIAATGMAQTEKMSEGVIIEKVALSDTLAHNGNSVNSWRYIARDIQSGVAYRLVPAQVDLPMGTKVSYDLGRWGADGSFGGETSKSNDNCGTCGTKVFRILGKA